MNPNAPSWNTGGGGNQYYNQNTQQQQYQQQYQQGYSNQYNQGQYQQQYQQPQQPQQQQGQYGYNAQQMQQGGGGYYGQSYGQNQNYQQGQYYGQNQNYGNQGYQNQQSYNRNTNYNNNNDANYQNQMQYQQRSNYNNNNNNNNNNNYNNNRNNNNRGNNRNNNQSYDEYDRGQYNAQRNQQNQQNQQNFGNDNNNRGRFDRDVDQLGNRLANTNISNDQSAQQQQQQPQQAQPQQQQEQQEPDFGSTNATGHPTTNDPSSTKTAPSTTNFDDDDEDDVPAQQPQGGKKKKRKKRRKKGKGGGAGGGEQGQPGQPGQGGQQTQESTPKNESSNVANPPAQQNEQPPQVEGEVSNKVETPDNSSPKVSTKTSNTEVTSNVVTPESTSSAKPDKKGDKKSDKKGDKKQGKKDKKGTDESKEESKQNDKKSKSKKKRPKANVNVHDSREHLNLVLIGHVDAGKSTLSGQILLQTGQIDDRTIAKYEKEAKERNRESWWIAYIMDEDDEERAKGKTVECGRAHFETSLKRYTILDAPGHKNYVPNMISGASQADVALLVISARRGEFDAGFNRGGQTREHALLAFTLGISRVVIVINKMDTCKWKKERFDDIEKKVRAFLVDVGFKSKYIDCVPVSGQSGDNVSPKNPVESKTCSWWKGKTLLDTLDGLKKLKRTSGGALRIPILDRYKGDKGLQAIGKIESGHISVGDTVVVMPTNTNCKISGLAIDDVNVENAVAGENVLISFESQRTNLSLDNIFGGCVLCSSGDLTPLTKNFRAAIALQSELPNNGIVTKGYTAMFHCHNVTSKCEITVIKHLVRKDGKRSRKPPAFLRAKQSAIVDIEISGAEVAIEEYKNFAQLGRFTLRDQGQTVAIGRIEKILGKNGEDPDESDQKSNTI